MSHHNKPHQVIPENLQMLAPGEQISIDFATFNNKTMLVVKDQTVRSGGGGSFCSRFSEKLW